MGADTSAAGDRAPAGIVRLRAPNPSAMTLDGTNTYLVEGWVVDPGPADDSHLAAIVEATGGTAAGIVLTHDHPDHAELAPALAERLGAQIVRPKEGETVGPFRALATPGHSADGVCLLRDRALFTGDTILGSGSAFVMAGDGSLAAYLDSLRRLRKLDLEVLCPGHGPFVRDPASRIDEYLEHRLDRERRLVGAIEAGARTREEMLDAVWSEVPEELRPFAAVTLEAHLEKLRDEGRLPGELPTA